MEAVSQVCLSHWLESLEYGNKFANASNLIAALEDINMAFDEMFFYCKWRNSASYCNEFKKLVTEEGLCYSFNAFHPKDIYREEVFLYDYLVDEFDQENQTLEWNLEDGYDKQAGPETFPYRVLGAGSRGGLFMSLKGNQANQDLLCRGPVQGFKILLNTPGEVPQVSQQFLQIPFNQEVSISIKPKIITTL
ncbi:pickpocket protein 28-like [Episyrphus balteatus]|uniref:pickpocket protein 28-like n=1 Tax=Episyrphus balteatus TaxID=286459 RepID=UPI002484DE4F|nr:pickpocket protein 28-like [Episyrphus balteatus]